MELLECVLLIALKNTITQNWKLKKSFVDFSIHTGWLAFFFLALFAHIIELVITIVYLAATKAVST